MLQTCLHLARLTELHLIVVLDQAEQAEAHRCLAELCASVEFLVRATAQPKRIGSITPHAIHEFASSELEWLIHRKTCADRIDVLQVEYLPMGQYAGSYRRLGTFLFEHDIYFQSIARSLPYLRGLWEKAGAAFEYMRALRYELRLLPRFDRVQVCSAENRAYVESFLPALGGCLDDDVRAGIDVRRYEFRPDGREPRTMLFLGSFRHRPNLDALDWFVKGPLPRVLTACPDARLIVIGSDPPVRLATTLGHGAIEFLGPVEDVREPLSRYAVFVCPILSGSGVRVKLLEAFAAGIPVVSTALGAEGLAAEAGRICALASDPAAFATKVIELFDNPAQAREMARRARQEMEAHRDIGTLTERLVQTYTKVLAAKRQ
jgi:glycosyltransferase involved in cell wall biosynthesis